MRFVVLSLAALLLAYGAAASSRAGTSAGLQGRIAFASNVDGGTAEVFVVNRRWDP